MIDGKLFWHQSAVRGVDIDESELWCSLLKLVQKILTYARTCFLIQGLPFPHLILSRFVIVPIKMHVIGLINFLGLPPFFERQQESRCESLVSPGCRCELPYQEWACRLVSLLDFVLACLLDCLLEIM